MAEIELSVLKDQCLDRRIADIATMQFDINVWEALRDNSSNQGD